MTALFAALLAALLLFYAPAAPKPHQAGPPLYVDYSHINAELGLPTIQGGAAGPAPGWTP